MSERVIGVPLSGNIDDSTIESLEILKRDLGAMGVRLTIPDVLPGGTLVFEYNDEAYKRNAGRKRKAVPADSPLAKMNQKEMDEWLLSASISEIQESLGIGRATAFRRVNEARSRVDYAVVSFAGADDTQ